MRTHRLADHPSVPDEVRGLLKSQRWCGACKVRSVCKYIRAAGSDDAQEVAHVDATTFAESEDIYAVARQALDAAMCKYFDLDPDPD